MEILGTEQWKPIPGYEGLYEASTWGRIRSAPGKTTSSARFAVRHWKTRIMKEKRPRSKKRQDGRVSLWKDGEHRDHLVSRLVASAFHGEPADGMTVNHINGDWLDNRPENLEWVSLQRNITEGFSSGQFNSICREIILKCEDGSALRFRSMAEASKFLGHNDGYISGVLKNRRFARDSLGVEYIVVPAGKEC